MRSTLFLLALCSTLGLLCLAVSFDRAGAQEVVTLEPVMPEDYAPESGMPGAPLPEAGVSEFGTIFTFTLRSNDFLGHSVSFGDGRPGTVVQDHQVLNRDSSIDFDNYFRGDFTVGIQGGEIAAIKDFGHWKDLAQRTGYSETVGGGQGFASIRFQGKELVIRQGTGGLQTFTEGNDFLKNRVPGGSRHVAARLGHVYMVRATNRHDSSFERITKFMVVGGHRSGREVTIAWENLERP